MESKLSKSDRTRQFIIESIAQVVNMKGYAGTTITDICEATGLTKGSIYFNFENKQEIALAVFDHNFDKLNNFITGRVNRAKTYADKVLAYAEAFGNSHEKVFLSGGCPVLNTAIDADDTNAPLKEKALAAVMIWKKSIEQLLLDGVAAGEFKAGIDHEQLALAIIALFEGGVMIAKVSGKINYYHKISNTIEFLLTQFKANG